MGGEMITVSVEVLVQGDTVVLFQGKWPALPAVGERFTYQNVNYQVVDRAWGVKHSGTRYLHDELCACLTLELEPLSQDAHDA